MENSILQYSMDLRLRGKKLAVSSRSQEWCDVGAVQELAGAEISFFSALAHFLAMMSLGWILLGSFTSA